jgi:hypothetical protein
VSRSDDEDLALALGAFGIATGSTKKANSRREEFYRFPRKTGSQLIEESSEDGLFRPRPSATRKEEEGQWTRRCPIGTGRGNENSHRGGRMGGNALANRNSVPEGHIREGAKARSERTRHRHTGDDEKDGHHSLYLRHNGSTLGGTGGGESHASPRGKQASNSPSPRSNTQ